MRNNEIRARSLGTGFLDALEIRGRRGHIISSPIETRFPGKLSAIRFASE